MLMEPRIERARACGVAGNSGTAGLARGRMKGNDMLAIGSCIAGAGLLVTGLLALLFRDPRAPRWTRPEIVAMLICVPVTVTTGFGLGHVALGLSRVVQGAEDPRELLVLGAVVLGLALAWYDLGIGRRLKEYAVATGELAPRPYLASEPTLVTEETPPSRPRSPAGKPGPRAA
jgi:hypothetical protein